MTLEEYKKKRENGEIEFTPVKPSNNNVTNTTNNSSKPSLWDQIKTTAKNMMNDMGGIGKNLYLGGKNGILNSQQLIGRNLSNQLDERTLTVQNTNNRVLERLQNKGRLTQNQVLQAKNNPIISIDRAKEHTKNVDEIFNNKKNINSQKIQENTEKESNAVGKYLAGNIAPSIGQMLPGFVGGPVGTMYFMTSAGGNYYDDAKQRGMNDKQADMYSGIMGIIEGSLESVGAKLTTNVGKSLLKKNIKGALVNYGLDIGENFLEEAIVEPISEVVTTMTAGKEKADWSNIWKRALDSGVAGAVTASIMGGVSGGIGLIGQKNRTGNYYDYKTGERLDKNTQNILKKAEEIASQNQIPNKNEINQNLSQNLQSQSIQDEINLPTQQTIQNNSEMAQNGISEQISENGDKRVENGNNLVYNATNESESGINGRETETIKQDDQRRNEGLFPQYGRGQENDRGYQGDLSREQEINYIRNKNNHITDLNENQKSIKDRYEAIGVPVNFYELESRNGGKYDDNTLYINTKNLSEEEQSNVATHEYAHHLLRSNNNFQNEISPIADKIIENENTGKSEAVRNYIMERTENIPVEELKTIHEVALEEILADYMIDIDNDVDFSKDNQYGIDESILNDYKDIVKKYLPPKISKDINIDKPLTRHEVIQNNREVARKNIENISTWKDKSNGLKYQLETMERNMYDIIPDKEEAKRLNDTYFEPIHQSEAEKQKFINKYNDKIKELNLNKYESEAVQFLGEKKYNPDFHSGDSESLNERNKIQNKINNNIKNGEIDINKVNNAIETFRNIYDELFEIENKALKENGYKEKDYRKGYFPHFIDYVPETKTEKVLNALGFKIDKRPLPTDIAGMTEQFVPGKTWNKSALQRKTNKTDYNALKGFDTYIAQASDNIFHTENIQKLRGLENEIRYQYSDKGVQERIDSILNDETLYEDEKQDLIDRIYEQIQNPLPNLVTELRRYTNALANKKSEADRSVENKIGRPIYSTINAIENRFGANAVGLNFGSAITNFIPITQAYSQVNTKNMGRAFIDTVKSYMKDDEFINKSTFLTNRINQAEKLYKTSLEKISDKTSFLFNAIDQVTSNIVVRGKYLQNIQDGMNEIEAIKDADRFAANVISDRSKGSLPTIFEEKNPITKMFTQFQLEVNNQFRYMFKDLPRDLKDKGVAYIALAFFKMFVGAWLYNAVSEKVLGRKPAFSPIDLAQSTYENFTDKNKSTYNKIADTAKEYGEQLPFIGGLLGGGRVPVNGAIPDLSNVTKAVTGLATGEMNTKKALNMLGKEAIKPASYLLPLFGGAQIKKSVEGISTIKNGGSYGIDKNGEKTLQFPVEDPTVKDYISAGLFGKYALPEAKTYTERGYKSLNAKDTKGYEDVNLPFKEFLSYVDSNLKKKEDKISAINNMNLTEDKKWKMYCYDIFDNTEREKDKGSQLSDAKYAISNGISKNDYIEAYNETSKRNMSMPTKDENEELKKAGISLKNYVDYQIKVHDKTKEQKSNGTLKDTQQLKNKDKIEILLNSNYSNNEKEAIYKEKINNEDKKIQLVDDLGFSLNEYLKYKQQEFKNDKDKDGETISGTKKSKVINYLKSISDQKLPIEYKKIIAKIEGINDYDEDIVEFILSNNKISGTKQKELLELIGFKVDKEGDISSQIMLPIKKYIN